MYDDRRADQADRRKTSLMYSSRNANGEWMNGFQQAASQEPSVACRKKIRKIPCYSSSLRDFSA